MKFTITMKRWRITISSTAVGSCESGNANEHLIREPLHKEFHHFYEKRGQHH